MNVRLTAGGLGSHPETFFITEGIIICSVRPDALTSERPCLGYHNIVSPRLILTSPSPPHTACGVPDNPRASGPPRRPHLTASPHASGWTHEALPTTPAPEMDTPTASPTRPKGRTNICQTPERERWTHLRPPASLQTCITRPTGRHSNRSGGYTYRGCAQVRTGACSITCGCTQPFFPPGC